MFLGFCWKNIYPTPYPLYPTRAFFFSKLQTPRKGGGEGVVYCEIKMEGAGLSSEQLEKVSVFCAKVV